MERDDHILVGHRQPRQYGAVVCALLMAIISTLMQSAVAQTSQTDGPEHGLIWHNSGLPAVFPLQIKTSPGRDYRITLTGRYSGTPVMAAYINGGRFFRVLVPPGTFTLRLEFGLDWDAQIDRFTTSDASGSFSYPDALTFRIRNGRVKAGHLLDLRNLHDDQSLVQAGETFICQTLRTQRAPHFASRYVFDRTANALSLQVNRPFSQIEDPEPERFPPIERNTRLTFGFDVRSRFCR